MRASGLALCWRVLEGFEGDFLGLGADLNLSPEFRGNEELRLTIEGALSASLKTRLPYALKPKLSLLFSFEDQMITKNIHREREKRP